MYVHKAAAVRSDEQVPDLFIASDAIMLPAKDPKVDRAIYEEEARRIVTALRRSLPEGTYARVVAEMMRRQAEDIPRPELLLQKPNTCKECGDYTTTEFCSNECAKGKPKRRG